MQKFVTLDKFAHRQFVAAKEMATRAAPVGKIAFDKQAFEDKVNEEIERRGGLDACLEPGYAPFCKHVFMKNFCGARTLDLAITEGNKHLLRTAYEARREGELPVLARFFDVADIDEVPEAEMLDIILYSREQINVENKSMGEAGDPDEKAPWGIISIKPQNQDKELPMQPITMLRNALGKEEGGSGVPLDKESYLKSVAYWSEHAAIKS
ncbi:Hypothetical Protein FCC1311_050552 [Hondaea fermentalgiana]|uniref:Flagellar associated protein n=1 Tax=Hondaea fermentalgiana TaxID=2315210 RepID=A0A2R5GLT7_9STRA|nr:Hypothetical Protein FCC1311_050552 [Hondaea fermentalgiana]|eukprot:GBG28834.1 Hypothetical Protein FCC1311_050552 [Hondaea fermentalgiana]